MAAESHCPGQSRFSLIMPNELREEAEAYAAANDASLGWVLRKGLRLLLDMEPPPNI